jgi:hypothetical protein
MHYLPVGNDRRVFNRQHGNTLFGRMRERVCRHQ